MMQLTEGQCRIFIFAVTKESVGPPIRVGFGTARQNVRERVGLPARRSN
jgi:hypothetical protein